VEGVWEKEEAYGVAVIVGSRGLTVKEHQTVVLLKHTMLQLSPDLAQKTSHPPLLFVLPKAGP